MKKCVFFRNYKLICIYFALGWNEQGQIHASLNGYWDVLCDGGHFSSFLKDVEMLWHGITLI